MMSIDLLILSLSIESIARNIASCSGVETGSSGGSMNRGHRDQGDPSGATKNFRQKNNRPTPFNTRLTALFPGLPGWAGTRKVKPIWILLKQETVSSSGISRAICKSVPRSRQITTPAPHHSSFLQAGCPSCRPTNSVKALKAKK